MCELEDELREREQQARPKPEMLIYIDKQSGLLWLPITYSSCQTRLYGTSIVARVNAHPTAKWGDFAAYMGLCPGNMAGTEAAWYIASQGVKINRHHAEWLFRPVIQKTWPEVRITWRP